MGLGSNSGKREENLASARELLGENGIEIQGVSSIYETEHWPREGAKDLPWHLNQVICARTRLLAKVLLKRTQEIEKELGRKEKGTNGSRPIDIDILLYGNLISHSPDLVIPHPRMMDRRFVLVPLVELNPDIKHPGSSKQLFRDILDELEPDYIVRPYKSGSESSHSESLPNSSPQSQ